MEVVQGEGNMKKKKKKKRDKRSGGGGNIKLTKEFGKYTATVE